MGRTSGNGEPMVSPVHQMQSKNSRCHSFGLPGRTLAASLAAGLVLGCHPNYDDALTRLNPREVVITDHSPGVYLARLTTSFRPEDGPRGQEYQASASDITLVPAKSGGEAWSDGSSVWATITVIEGDGSVGAPVVETWSLEALGGEGDTGEEAPPYISISYHQTFADAGSMPREIDLRIEFETDSQVPVRLRWHPVGYVRMFYMGCIGTDGWVDLDIEAQPGTSDQVVEAGDTG